MRKAVAAAKVCLCLARRANRDGHAMRSFELPAMRACMLVEDSAEHRAIFGAEREAVLYFNSTNQMVGKARELCANSELRKALAFAAHQKITRAQNTYADRLGTILAQNTPSQ